MKKRGSRTVQRERRIYHGKYLTVHIFPVFRKAGARTKKCKPTDEAQKKLNQKYREEKITYLINENFSDEGIEIGAGFDDEHLPTDYEGAKKAVQNFIRRLKRYIKKNNLPELKYIYCIEKGKKNGRFHFHMILNGISDIHVLKRIWGKGYVWINGLEYDNEGLKGIAKYIVKEPETETAIVEGKVRRWCSSKNLKQPFIPKDRDGYISKKTSKQIRMGEVTEREIERLYPGYTVSSVEPFYNNYNAGEYITIRLHSDVYRKPTGGKQRE